MNPLHGRATSGFPLSIATGLAMETLFTPQQQVYDPERVSPPRITVSSYQELFINVLTLIRNAYQACDAGVAAQVSPMHMVEIIMQEIELIRDLMSNEGKGFAKVVFYFNDYKTLFKRDSLIFKRREDKTYIQKQARFVYDKASEMISRQDDQIKLFNLTLLTTGVKSSLVLTHLPADLLSYNRFQDLGLLESHTGKVKGSFEWNSKYHPCGETDMGRLPFNRQLLSVFGDHSLIVPLPLKARRLILELAIQQRWTPATSVTKVSGDISYFLKDHALAEAIRSIPIF